MRGANIAFSRHIDRNEASNALTKYIVYVVIVEPLKRDHSKNYNGEKEGVFSLKHLIW